MTVAADALAFGRAGPEHVDAIAANNIAMARETEDLALPPATVHKGVTAVLDGTHGAQARRTQAARGGAVLSAGSGHAQAAAAAEAWLALQALLWHMRTPTPPRIHATPPSPPPCCCPVRRPGTMCSHTRVTPASSRSS